MTTGRNQPFTVIIVPQTDRRTINLRLPGAMPLIAAGVVLLLVAILFGFGARYRQLQRQMNELRIMRRINAEQNLQIEVISQKSEEMAADLNKLRDLDQQVRKLVGETREAPAPAAVKAMGGGAPAPTDVDAALARRDVTARGGFDRSRSGLVAALSTSARLDTLRAELDQRLSTLKQTKVKIDDYREYLKHRPTGWPVDGEVTSPYGWRASPFDGSTEWHPGVDIANASGTPVAATADGVVAFVGWNGSYGKLVIVDHGYDLKTYYAHLRAYEVQEGQQVKRGQVVGYIGSTGASTGPHLHYEVRSGGAWTDPKPYLDG